MFKRSFFKKLAKKERVNYLFLESQFKKGRVVIPFNKNRKLDRPTGIGEGLKIKINTNIGTSPQKTNLKNEIDKLEVALEYGSDTIMDLSIGGDTRKIRKTILEKSPVPVGTVPVYEAALEVERKTASFEKMTFDNIWEVMQEQAKEGVDFFTIHAGILRSFLNSNRRIGGIVSRGGAILARWMYVNKKENPFFENFDKILSLAKQYNITLSLGDALRPGAIADSSDNLQFSELFVLGKLVKKCRKKGVQVMVEGPGHIRLDEIAFNMAMEKKLCDYAPFYVLGPLPTDIAAGYDHITAAIGGSFASLYGADFLCVVTPAEHLSHPSCKDIREGVIATSLAAHIVNLLRFKDEEKRDYNLSLFRAKRDWDSLFSLALDKEKAQEYRKKNHLSYLKNSSLADMCTMCGEWCSLKIIEKTM